ncbi:MAG TPA: xanthine dehydrogenase family protein molybdopterin-binding subunit [Gemmatimonadaceae bacterium]|jgi:xanthine dehydrogenase YagR molybdenum-binding subunit
MTTPDTTRDAGLIGRPINRVDGPKKVTGSAKYAADYDVPELLHGVIVSSPMAGGMITAIDDSAALAIPGVVTIYTHEKRPDMPSFRVRFKDLLSPPGKPYRPLHDERILFAEQPVALVLADSYEAARDAADLVQVSYQAGAFETALERAQHKAFDPRMPRLGIATTPDPRGDADAAFAAAPVTIEAEYRTAPEFHHPIELFATTAVWETEDTLTVYDKTQGAQNTHLYLRLALGLKPHHIRVVNHYVGGAFGIGLRPSYAVFLAAIAAKELHRPVRVTMTRSQMHGVSYRAHSIQKVSLACDRDGQLAAIRHRAVCATSNHENFQEAVVNWSGLAYKCDNVSLEYKLARVATPTPADMRAPGAATGLFALECAMDELAVATKIDPVALRLKNWVDYDQNEDKAITSKAQRECYAQAAERFGWATRSPAPRSMRDGNELIGWGVAGGIWEAVLPPMPIRAKATWRRDGRLEIAAGTTDIGTGSYTIFAQIAAEAFGLRPEQVVVRLGDSRFPLNAVEGGSWTAASTGAAVATACEKLKREIAKAARKHGLLPRKATAATFDNGYIASPSGGSVRIANVVEAVGSDIAVTGTLRPSLLKSRKEVSYSHSAAFVEVRVDAELGVVRVTRVVTAIAAGRILNPKTARSQILGGVVMGIGKALHEEGMFDHRFGKVVNHNLADYHVPSNADVYDIDVIFVDERDEKVSPLGVKGVGEIGIVGVAPAIANAIYHATGRRIRELPITPDKLL